MREKPRNFAKMRQPHEQRKEKPPCAHTKTVAFFFKVWYTFYNARRRGSSGSLYRQSAIAGLKAFPDGRYGRYARRKER